ncbi:hypothetical protein GCM10009773_29160 [Williamsia serinedens]
MVTGVSVVGTADDDSDAVEVTGELRGTDELEDAVEPSDPSLEHAARPAMATTDHPAITAHISTVVRRRRELSGETDVRIMPRLSEAARLPLLRAANVHAIARHAVENPHRQRSPRSW